MSDTNDEIEILVASESGNWTTKHAGGLQRAWNDMKKEFRRGRRDLDEFLSPARMLSETFFSGYGEHMKQLRAIDNEIQSWLYDLDNCLDQAKDARKDNRLLDVIFWLSQINDRLRLASRRGKEVVDIHEEHINNFLGRTNQPVLDDYFSEIPSDHKDIQQRLVRASIREWMANRKMQQLYKQQMEKKKLAANSLYNSARITVTNCEALLETMATARAKGDIGSYIDAVKSISQEQKQFESIFRKVYTANFADLADAMRKRRDQLLEEQAKAAPQNGQAEEGQAPAIVNPSRSKTIDGVGPLPSPQTTLDYPFAKNTKESPRMEPAEPAKPPMRQIPDLPPIPKMPQKSIIMDTSSPTSDNLPDLPDLIPDSGEFEEVRPSELIIEEAPKTSRGPAMAAFYTELEKVAQTGNLDLMITMISKYSEKLEDQDPVTSQKLLVLAESMLDV
jgi:hypothetical protein